MAVISKALSVIVWNFSIFFLPHIDMLRFTFVPPPAHRSPWSSPGNQPVFKRGLAESL